MVFFCVDELHFQFSVPVFQPAFLRSIDDDRDDSDNVTHGQPDISSSAGGNFADDNERHRQSGLNLVGSNNSMKIAQLKIIGEPLAQLLKDIMHVGGKNAS